MRGIQLPVPESYELITQADVIKQTQGYEALRDEISNERKNLHDFLLKQEFRLIK